MMSDYNIVPTVQPRAKSSKGIVRDIWEGVFGEHDAHAAAIKEMQRHGAGFRKFAHGFSYLMLAMFSAQGVLAQVSDDAKAVWASLQAGQTPDFYKLLTVLIVVAFNVGLDIALIAMFEEIRHKRAQGESAKGATTFVVIGSFVESATYLVVILGIHNWIVTGFLLVLRAGMLPFVAAILATLTARLFTHKDYKQTQAVRMSLHAIDYTNHVLGQIDPRKIDGGALISALASVMEMTPAEAQQMQNHAAAIATLLPDNMQAQRQAEIQKIEAAYQQQLQEHTNENSRLMDRVSSLEAAVNHARMAATTARHEAGIQAESDMGNMLQKVLLSLAYQHTMPADIVERYPELSGLDVESMFQQPARHSRGNAPAKATQETPDNAEGQRAFLARIMRDLDLKGTLYGTPKGHKGVWVLPAMVVALSGKKVSDDSARSIVRSLSHDAKIGTTYAAPFADVMEHLSNVHALGDEAARFWQSTEDSVIHAVA